MSNVVVTKPEAEAYIAVELTPKYPGVVFEMVGSVKNQGYSSHDLDIAVQFPFGKPWSWFQVKAFAWMMFHTERIEEAAGYGFRTSGQWLVQGIVASLYFKDRRVPVDFFFPRAGY